MRTSILILLLAAPTLLSQTPWWSGSFEGAFAAAKARNVPLLIAFNVDEEEASDRAVSLYRTPEFVAFADRVVPLIVSPSSHEEESKRTGETTHSVCSRFGRLSCAQHRQLERQARVLLFGGIEKPVIVPSHFLVLPDRSVAWKDQEDVPTVDVLAQGLERAQRKLGRGLSGKTHQEIVTRLSDARNALANDQFGVVVVALAELRPLTEETPFSKDVTLIGGNLDQRLASLIKTSEELSAKGDALGALRVLSAADQELAKKPEGKVLRAALSALRKTKEGRAAQRAFENEEKARPFLEQAREAERAGEWLVAIRRYGVVITRANGTPMANLAERRLEELSRDPDIGPLVLAERRANAAQEALRAARRLERTDPAAGREALKKLVEEFPDTPAAEAAQKLIGAGG